MFQTTQTTSVALTLANVNPLLHPKPTYFDSRYFNNIYFKPLKTHHYGVGGGGCFWELYKVKGDRAIHLLKAHCGPKIHLVNVLTIFGSSRQDGLKRSKHPFLYQLFTFRRWWFCKSLKYLMFVCDLSNNISFRKFVLNFLRFQIFKLIETTICYPEILKKQSGPCWI